MSIARAFRTSVFDSCAEGRISTDKASLGEECEGISVRICVCICDNTVLGCQGVLVKRVYGSRAVVGLKSERTVLSVLVNEVSRNGSNSRLRFKGEIITVNIGENAHRIVSVHLCEGHIACAIHKDLTADKRYINVKHAVSVRGVEHRVILSKGIIRKIEYAVFVGDVILHTDRACNCRPRRVDHIAPEVAEARIKAEFYVREFKVINLNSGCSVKELTVNEGYSSCEYLAVFNSDIGLVGSGSVARGEVKSYVLGDEGIVAEVDNEIGELVDLRTYITHVLIVSSEYYLNLGIDIRATACGVLSGAKRTVPARICANESTVLEENEGIGIRVEISVGNDTVSR